MTLLLNSIRYRCAPSTVVIADCIIFVMLSKGGDGDGDADDDEDANVNDDTVDDDADAADEVLVLGLT